MKKVVITGPESTGKTHLAAQLADQLACRLVPEMARAYLEENGPSYTADDVLKIARLQVQAEKEAEATGSPTIICDTDLRVIRIWLDVKFGMRDPWVDAQIKSGTASYLLCHIDLPWEPDPLREDPDNREQLFALFHEDLERDRCSYEIVRGQGEQRLKNALSALNRLRDR